MTNKKVNPAKYCAWLTKPPVVKGDYQNPEDLYICKLTTKPCVARWISDQTQSYDVFSYSRPEIDEETLDMCPAHNLGKDIAKLLLEDMSKRKSVDIVGRIDLIVGKKTKSKQGG